MNSNLIIENLKRLNDFKILIVGDVMLDSYVWGNVSRISPEAPVPILSLNSKEDRLGGAANVAKNIKSLGAHAAICTVIGDDEKGDTLVQLFDKNEFDIDGVVRTKSRRTTVKTRFLGGAHHMLRVDEEDMDYISVDLEDELFHKIENKIATEEYQAIIFQDYDKGVLTPKLINNIKSLAKENDIITVVDPKNRNFFAYSDVTLFKPNLKEFSEGIGKTINTNNIDGLINEVDVFRKENNISRMLVTLSEKGLLAVSKDGVWKVSPQTRKIADVSGAGDTVIAVATLCMLAGIDMENTAKISNLAGSIVCQYPVVVSIDKEELCNEILKLE